MGPYQGQKRDLGSNQQERITWVGTKIRDCGRRLAKGRSSRLEVGPLPVALPAAAQPTVLAFASSIEGALFPGSVLSAFALSVEGTLFPID